MQAILTLTDEASKARWRVWPDADAVPPGAIAEARSYIFELMHPEAAAAELFVDEIPLEALRATAQGAARWRWTPGFNAGEVSLAIRAGGIIKRLELTTDPDFRKLTRNDFDQMIREILEDTFALFSLSSFHRTVARGVGSKPPAIARLQFLRTRIERIERIAIQIANRPRHQLANEEMTLPLYRAARASGQEILRSLATSTPARAEKPERLPAALKGFLPRNIRHRRRRPSIDIPEHRQMAAVMRGWSAWLFQAAGVLERAAAQNENGRRHTASLWALRCRRLAQRLSHLTDRSAFREVGDAVPKLVLSALFRNDARYREFYALWRDINLGIAAVFGDYLDLPLARTFELYELWCFLRLTRAARASFGDDALDVQDLFVRDAAGRVTLSAGAVTVRAGAWTLCFQRSYREFWLEADGRGSYSRTMTPDIVFADTTQANYPLIVLDAKYRVHERLNDALSSIHMYRDALVREVGTGTVQGIVKGAYLLAPHLPLLTDDYRATAMPGRLFHPQYRGSFRFGAVSLRPGMSQVELSATLQMIIEDASG